MTDFRALLADLRRPQLLIRAARLGLADYRRDRDLRRLLDAQPSPIRAVTRLLGEEEVLEATRKSGAVGYSVSRHIEVLIALMAEVSLLPRLISASGGDAGGDGRPSFGVVVANGTPSRNGPPSAR